MMKPGEICDDGARLDNVGCTSDCLGNLPGWNCLGGSLTTPVTCFGICGDGFIKGTEQCDDGNTNDYDGCSAFCSFESGWTCSNTYSSVGDTTTCTPICGDGRNVGLEVCDDGNIFDSIGCLANCTGEINGWHCLGGDINTARTCSE